MKDSSFIIEGINNSNKDTNDNNVVVEMKESLTLASEDLSNHKVRMMELKNAQNVTCFLISKCLKEFLK